MCEVPESWSLGCGSLEGGRPSFPPFLLPPPVVPLGPSPHWAQVHRIRDVETEGDAERDRELPKS